MICFNALVGVFFMYDVVAMIHEMGALNKCLYLYLYPLKKIVERGKAGKVSH